MKKPILLTATALLLLSACQQRTISNQATTQTAAGKASGARLADADLFHASTVVQFLQDHPADDGGAQQAFNDAIAAYRKQKNVAEGRRLLVESICQHPSSAAYFELGNADMDAKDYNAAILAYGMAEQLGYEPHARTLYNLACAYSRAGKADTAKDYLEYALEAGYNNETQLQKDPDLAAARKNYSFVTTVQTAQSGAVKPQVASLRAFLRGFKEAKLPLTLNEKTGAGLLASVNDDEERYYISYDHERYVPEMKGQPRFSREGGKTFYCLNKVAATPQYTAVVYAFQNVGDGEEAPFAYSLVTYDNSGRIIDKLYAGQRDEKAPYRVVTIQPGLTIVAKDYQQKWAKDPVQDGYYENRVVSSSLLRNARYHIAADGRIQRDDAVVGLK